MPSMDIRGEPVIVLLVDDDMAYLEVLKFFLEREGTIECEMSTSAKDALDLLSRNHYDAIVSDYLMPEMDGLELLKIVRLQGKDVPFIMLTGRGREDVAIQAINNGADFYIQKGGDPKAQYTDLANMIRKSTSERRAVSSAREGERFLRRVFESVQDGVSILNREMVIERVNPTIERWYSDSMPIVGKKCHEAYHHSPSPCPVCPVIETIRSATAHRERIKTDINGEGPKWLDVFSYPIIDGQTGEVDGVIEYMRDISEEEDSRRALEASERARRAITDLSNEGMLAIEAGGRITFANPRMATLLGCTVDDIVGKQIGSLVDRKWLESVGPGRLHKILEEGERVELMMVRKDGSPVRVIVAASPTSTEGGMFEGAVAVVMDVSELSAVIEGMVSLEDRFAKMFQTSPQMIMVARAADSVILDANDSFLNATGYSLDQLTGKSYTGLGLVSQDLSSRIEREIAEKGMVNNLETTLGTSSGGDRVVRLSCYKLELQGQEYIVFLSCDLTSEGVGVKELRLERDVLKTILESTPDGIVITDLSGNVIECNAAVCRMLGDKSKDEILGQDVFSLVDPGDRPKALRIKEKLTSERVVKDIPFRLRREDEIVVTVGASAAIVNDSLGKPLYVVTVVHDVTDQTRYQSAIETALEERRQMEAIIEASPAVAIRWIDEPGWPVDYVSSNVSAIGYDAATLTSRSIDFLSIIHPDDREKVVEEAERYLKEGRQEFEQEYRIVSPQGKVFWVYDKTSVLRDSSGKLESCQGVIVNITDMKETLERLSRTEEQMKLFMDMSPVVKFMKDRDGRYVYVNKMHEELFGDASSTWIGKTDHELLPKDIADRLVEADRKVFETGGPLSVIESVPQPDGIHEYVTYKFLVPNTSGEGNLLAGVAIDMTEQRRYERALKGANEKLNLLGEMTRHDIMNQLSILTSWLQVLLEEETDAEKSKRLDTLRDSADIIRGLLMFASEYQDMGAQEPVWVDLTSAFQNGLQGLPLQGVAVELDVPLLEVYADPMFERVFRNLVDNSLRHGERVSRVRLSVRPEGQARVIVYEDDGSGVPDTVREHIFERGFGKHTGMGLFMVREILGITGMTIRETGKEGSGARFEIVVPEGGSRIQPGKD